MIWIEMSRDESHGGPGWEFGRALWAPERKGNGQRWPYWSAVKDLREGDTVLHLRGKDGRAAFVALSTVASEGDKTDQRPPQPGQWASSPAFLRAELRDFDPFHTPIRLRVAFEANDAALRGYFWTNRARPKTRRQRIFYVVQSDRLQCLNGAYLSQCEPHLFSILLGSEMPNGYSAGQPSIADVETSEQIRTILARIGQQDFSQVVRANYGERCCFPGCEIDDSRLLIGSHIARWTDIKKLRGRVGNGLCLCALHDRAFETGFFTVDCHLRVRLNAARLKNAAWEGQHLRSGEGQQIRKSTIPPLREALEEHWKRIQFTP